MSNEDDQFWKEKFLQDDLDETVKELHESEAKLKIALEALEFYEDAFDIKMTSSGMGKFTPFLVDRGARAHAAIIKIRNKK